MGFSREVLAESAPSQERLGFSVTEEGRLIRWLSNGFCQSSVFIMAGKNSYLISLCLFGRRDGTSA